MTTNRNLKLYFPNLNGLRFIAACFVMINHTEQLKVFYDLSDGVQLQSIKNIGKLGVVLFFVLSGFLITYLLLSEERSFGKIHVKKFYIRRLLRIAPLYALAIILVYFVIQNVSFLEIPKMQNPIKDNFYPTLILHALFLPNVATAIYGFLPYIAQAWSIGTEEQSYVLWPLLLKWFKKNRLVLMIGIIVFYFVVKVVLRLTFLSIPYQEIISKFWAHFNIDTIAVGGLFAVLLFQKHKLLKLIINQKTFYSTLLVTVPLLLIGVKIPFLHFFTYACLFGIIIINLAANKNLKKVLEGRVINYLGQISYGIYIYHFMVLIPVLIFASKFNIKTNWIIYPLLFIGTIGISSLSYHYFEAIFLRFKTKFSYIKSGGSEILTERLQ